MKIVFVSPFLPWPQNVGMAIRVQSMLTALQLMGEVECVFFDENHEIEKLPEDILPEVFDYSWQLLLLLNKSKSTIVSTW